MITNVKATNFRSIISADVDLALFSMLIGANGAGKTTLISAIDLTGKLASGMSLNNTINNIAPLRRDLFHFGQHSNETSLEMTLRDSVGRKYKLSYKIAQKNQESEYLLSIVEESLSRLDSDNKEVKIYYRHRDTIMGVPPKSDSTALQEIPLTIDEDKLLLSSYSNKEVKEIANLMSSSVVLWLNNESTQWGSGFNIISSSDPKPTIEHQVIKLYEASKKHYEEAVQVIKRIIPEFEEPRVLDITEDMQKTTTRQNDKKSEKIKNYVVFWRENKFDQSFTKQSMSSGNRKVVELIFNLYNCKNSYMLIGEELENGLHYARIQSMVEILKYLSKKLKVQLLFTTHSPQILNFVSPREVIYCSKDGRNRS